MQIVTLTTCKDCFIGLMIHGDEEVLLLCPHVELQLADYSTALLHARHNMSCSAADTLPFSCQAENMRPQHSCACAQGWSLAGTCLLKVRKPNCRCMDPTSGRLRYHHIHCMLSWKMSNHTYLLCTCTVLTHLFCGTTAVAYFSRHQTHSHPPSV